MILLELVNPSLTHSHHTIMKMLFPVIQIFLNY